MNDIKIFFKKLHSKAKIPTYAKPGDACCDLYSVEDYTINAGKICLVSMGFSMEMPDGIEAQIRPRSGNAFKYGVTVLNSPGTIDCGYRNEIKVILINLGDKPFAIKVGDRVAQMKFSPVYTGHFLDVGENKLSISVRDKGGLGHTGK